MRNYDQEWTLHVLEDLRQVFKEVGMVESANAVKDALSIVEKETANPFAGHDQWNSIHLN